MVVSYANGLWVSTSKTFLLVATLLLHIIRITYLVSTVSLRHISCYKVNIVNVKSVASLYWLIEQPSTISAKISLDLRFLTRGSRKEGLITITVSIKLLFNFCVGPKLSPIRVISRRKV